MEIFREDLITTPRWNGEATRDYCPPEVLRCATVADAALVKPDEVFDSTRTATDVNPAAGVVAPATGASTPTDSQDAKPNEPPATATGSPTHTAAAAPQPTRESPADTGTVFPSKSLQQDRQGRFRCGLCDGGLKVINSRPQDGYRLRRYQCVGCTERITTVEVVVPGDINPHCSLDSAVARVMQVFVRRASLPVLERELRRRQEASQ